MTLRLVGLDDQHGCGIAVETRLRHILDAPIEVRSKNSRITGRIRRVILSARALVLGIVWCTDTPAMM